MLGGGKVIVGRGARLGITLGVWRRFRYQSQFKRWSLITVVDVNGDATDQRRQSRRPARDVWIAKAEDYLGTNLNPVGAGGVPTNWSGAVEYLPITLMPSEASA